MRRGLREPALHALQSQRQEVLVEMAASAFGLSQAQEPPAMPEARRNGLGGFDHMGRNASTAFFESRLVGPATPTAATTSPLSLRIGDAMQRMPISLSSSSIA